MPKWLLAVLFWMITTPALAQAPEGPSRPPVLIGPIELYPSLALLNFGVDSNVFNEPNQYGPKRDLTMTITPATDVRLRLGRVRLTAAVREDFVYYHTYASERTANSSLKGGLQTQVSRVILKAGASYLSTRDRPGFEIDTRAQREEVGVNGTVEIRAFPKLFVGLRGAQLRIDYDQNAVVRDRSLRVDLKRTMTMEGLGARYRLTPLTSLTLDLSLAQDRFDLSPFRDADSTRIMAGATFEQRALIKGSAAFGYRDFRPLSSDTAPYRGGVVAADLTTAVGPTKLGLRVNRDVEYSYELYHPYYVQTSATGSITQHLFGAVDLIGRFGLARLDYWNRFVAGADLPPRTDSVRAYGVGLASPLARRMRIAFNVDQSRRTSSVELRQYDGLTFGTSVTYEYWP